MAHGPPPIDEGPRQLEPEVLGGCGPLPSDRYARLDGHGQLELYMPEKLPVDAAQAQSIVKQRAEGRELLARIQEQWVQLRCATIAAIRFKASGVGLNLTAADSAIHYDPWWNPAVENQATDRAHRLGQDKRVFVYKLIVAGRV